MIHVRHGIPVVIELALQHLFYLSCNLHQDLTSPHQILQLCDFWYYFQVFDIFFKFLDAFGPVQTHSDLFRRLRVRSDACGINELLYLEAMNRLAWKTIVLFQLW